MVAVHMFGDRLDELVVRFAADDLASGRALVELAPLRESGHRLLMRALAAEGNAAEALAVYDVLRVRLRDELGAAPAPETRELHRALLRD